MAAVEIPQTCKAGVCTQYGPDYTMAVEHVAVPEPGPGELLIKLNVTGICASDIHYMVGDFGKPDMSDFKVRSPGHEGAGVVVKLGPNVKGWKIGDRAGVKPVWDTCRSCELCWNRHETYCPKAIMTGVVVPGTYQQYIVSPALYTTPIPDGVSDHVAGPIMCSGSTIYRSITEAQLKPSQWAVFMGAGGGVGHMGVQIARAMGLRVIGVDTGTEKEELCRSLGCEVFIDFQKVDDMVEEVIKVTGGLGAHGVFVTATSKIAYATATKMCRVGGKVMCIALPARGSTFVGDDPFLFVVKNIHVIGTLVGSMSDTNEALKLAAMGLLKPIYETFSIDQLPDAVAKLGAGKMAGRGIIEFDS